MFGGQVLIYALSKVWGIENSIRWVGLAKKMVFEIAFTGHESKWWIKLISQFCLTKKKTIFTFGTLGFVGCIW